MGLQTLALMERVRDHARAASTEPARWAALVHDLGQLFSARSTVLFTPEPAADTQPFGTACGDIVHGVEDYFANWAHDDAWLNAVAGKEFFHRAGEVRFSHEFLSNRDLRTTAFFNDWCRTYSTEQSLALKLTDETDRDAPVMHLVVFRRLADEPFTLRDRTRLQMLWPVLREAVRSYWATKVLQAGNAVESTLEVLPTPTWVVRPDAHIEFANAAARALTQARHWVRERDGCLRAMGHLDAQALSRCIHDAGTWVVSADIQDRILCARLRVVPIAETALYASEWPRGRALLMLHLPPSHEQDGLWLAHLSERFKLTPRQCSVLESLSKGQSIEDIAAADGIKRSTVRTHLHELLSKTGRSRQADLVRLALGG